MGGGGVVATGHDRYANLPSPAVDSPGHRPSSRPTEVVACRGLPAPGGLARAGGARRSGPRSATRSTGAGRCPASATRTRAVAGRRPGAGRARRQPHRPDVHRRPLRRLPLRAPCTAPASPTSRRASHRDDGLVLTGAWITAPVRCAPPANKPTPDERDPCRPYLERELALLDDLRVFVLPRRRSATRSCAGLLGVRPRPRFGHGVEVAARRRSPDRCARSTSSQQNTFTGKLTEPMLDAVFARAATLAGLSG